MLELISVVHKSKYLFENTRTEHIKNNSTFSTIRSESKFVYRAFKDSHYHKAHFLFL